MRSRSLLAFASPMIGPMIWAACPAHAQAPSQPPLMPIRDVQVMYDVQPEAAPAPQRITVWFSGNGRLMRIDSPDGQGSTILDRDRKLMTVLINNAHVYMQVPEAQTIRSPFLLDPSMGFTAAGVGSVAGLACNRWNITAADGGSAVACITADGVVLSESGVDQQGARGHLEATQVTYGPIPASAFAPPLGYDRVAHPEGPSQYERSGNTTTDGPHL